MKERTRTIILFSLLALAIGFIWLLQSEVGNNFVDKL